MGSALTNLIGSNGSCDTIKDIYGSSVLLPLGAALSSFCYLYLFYFYFVKKHPALMRHPSTIAVYKCIFEFAFVQQYLWEPFLPNYALYDSTNSYCKSSAFAGLLAFCSQFLLLGGELMFLVISIDLYLAYTNPFSAFSQYKYIYAALTLGLSLLTAGFLIYLGPDAYGVSSEGVVWIQDRRGEDNYIKIILFYDFMGAIYAYCIVTVVLLTYKMKQGFAKTLIVRLTIMKRSQTYIIGYSLYWGILFSLEFISYLLQSKDPTHPPPSSAGLADGAAYCFAFRGLWSVGVILYTNSKDITLSDLWPFSNISDKQDDQLLLAVEEGISMKPHLNSALRAEILYFTTKGIIFSAGEYYHLNNKSRRNKPNNSNSNLHGNTVREDSEFEDSRGNSSMGILRESSFSFRDKLQLGGFDESMNSLFRSSMTVLPAMNSLNKQALDGGNGPLTLVEPLLELNSRIEIQKAKTRTSIRLEVEKEAQDNGIAMSNPRNSDNVNLGNQSNSISSRGSAHNPSNPMQQTVTSHSKGSRNLSDDPFYAHEELERQWNRNNNNNNSNNNNNNNNNSNNNSNSNNNIRQNPIHINNRDTEKSSLSSISDGNSSNSTLKWKDASQLKFRMITDAMHSQTSSIDKGNSEEINESKFERLERIRSNNTTNTLNPRVRSNSSTSGLQRFADTIWNALVSVGYNNYYDDFTFTDFSPRYFAEVRELCGIDPNTYVLAFENTANEKFTEGRSGAFMFSSIDSRFIVKTTTEGELRKLLKIMPKYLSHLKSNPHSLIIKFLGAHCITMYATKIYFLVMLNVFPRERLSEKYDLKGSWVNRSRKVDGSKLTRKERQLKSSTARSAPLLLDGDLQQKFNIDEDVAVALRRQIQIDTKFLSGLELMDYSLLVGVVTRHFEVVALDESPSVSSSNRPSSVTTSIDTILDTRREAAVAAAAAAAAAANSTTAVQSPIVRDVDGAIGAEIVQAPGTYYFGIIDILQEWNFSKKVEHFYKVYFKFNAAEGISAIPPKQYQKRFMTRVANDIFEFGDAADNSGFTSGRSSLRQKSRVTENSICIMTDSPRGSSMVFDDLEFAEQAF